MKRSTPYLIAGLVFAVFATPVLYVWSGLHHKSARGQAERLHLLAEQSALRVEEYLQSRFLALQVLQQGTQTGLFLEEKPFSDQSAAIQGEFGGFQAVNWIDPSYTIRWVVPIQGNEGAMGRFIGDNSVAQTALIEAVNQREAMMSAPMDLFQGGRGFATYFPVWTGEPGQEVLQGFVNGVFRNQLLIEGALDAGLRDQYLVHVFDEDLLVYEPPNSSAERQHEILPASQDSQALAIAEINVLNRKWSLLLEPKASLVPFVRADRHLSLLVGGLSFSLALAVLAGMSLLRREEQRKQLAAERAMDERFAQAQKMEAVGQLAGGIAHDFNNLLTAITGSASLAMADVPNKSRAAKHLQRLLHACQRAAEMTGRLLTFSHASRVEQVDCDVGAELEELRGLLLPLVREDIAMHYEVGNDLGQIHIAPAELGQILVNLVTNAVAAMPQGGHLWVRGDTTQLDAHGERGDWVKLLVRDTGQGMTGEVQDRVFEPFFSTKEAGQGTGFGLATVYGIVRRASGSVHLESTVGKGTEFSIFLPRESLTPSVKAEVQASSGVTPWQGSILVVEDDPEVREIMHAILRKEGHQVRTARHGAEALELLRNGTKVDLICSDAVMPEMGGIELAKRARALGFQGGFVVCTGYTTDLSAQDMLDLDLQFLSKPFKPEDLITIVTSKIGPGAPVA